MQEKMATSDGAKPQPEPYRSSGSLAPRSQRAGLAQGAGLTPRSIADRLKVSSATLLARLEAENAVLRDRAVELALHIQELAEQQR
jgi:hypothetical protein